MLPLGHESGLGAGSAALMRKQSVQREKSGLKSSWAVSEALSAHWPHYFTLFMLTVFGAPIIAAFHLAQDESIEYWVGATGLLPLAIPFYLALCHILHLRGHPKLLPIVASSVVPSILLFVVGNSHIRVTGIMVDMLMSTDCTTFAMKQDLHRSWMVAAALYDDCVNRTALEKGISYEEGLQLWRLHEFEEYGVDVGSDEDVYAQHRPKWEYLRRMEENHLCAGWCWHSRPLWAFGEVRDSCSSTAGALLRSKVTPLASRIMTFSALTFFVAVFAIMYLGANIRRYGDDWERI